MDLLQIALILLIVLLGVFLSVTGVQVFFILRDLKKALDRLTGEEVKESKSSSTSKSQAPTRRLFRRK